MTNIRRIHCPGYPYFITNITKNRWPFLIDNVDLFWEAVNNIKNRIPFELYAWVILPEHFHLLVYPQDGNISDFMNRLKMSVSMNYRKRCDYLGGPIWQHRFWDHIIRNDEDLKRHLDYIHINPVKHGHVKRAHDWPHSSIHLFKDDYPEDWGCAEEIKIDGDFGE
jgi:putative transposase